MYGEATDPKQAKALFAEQLKAAEQLAELANRTKCDITIGSLSARPALQERMALPSPVEESRQLLSWLREPLKAFLEKLAPG